MSPILVRPVREQLEHDRVIRLLQAKYKRKFEVAINPGNEQTVPVGADPSPWYPDLVLQSQERSRKLLGVIEVETTESVNNLEAMSQWVAFSRLRVPFHLYVPAGCVDSARRLCTDLDVSVEEMWAFHSLGDQLRFTLVSRSPQAEAKGRATTEPADAPRARAVPARGAGARAVRPSAAQPARRATPAATTARRAPAKAKPAAPRRAVKAAARKSGSAPSRAQKRR